MERVCRLVMGDLLVELVDGHGLRAIDIARATGYRQSDLSEILRTARTFPSRTRPRGIPYNQFLMAARVIAKFPELKLAPAAALDQIRQLGLSQHRDVTRHFDGLARATVAKTPAMLADLRGLSGPFNRAYHSRFQDLLGLFPDRSISLLHIDPPYLYSRGVYGSRSSRSLECDGDDPQAAIGMVVDLLRDWQPKLKPNGVVLLWQPWGNLHPEISQAIQTYRWEVWGPIIWDKLRPQPGDFSFPYSQQGEMLWMLHRPGDAPVNCDGSPRGSILRFPPVSFPSLAGEQEHGFQKSQELCEFLVRKHTHPGELVFDACGCTGTMSLAAIRAGRQWIYAESNAKNYSVGAGRIAAALTTAKSAAS
jgi:DNA modification methylase